MRNQSTRKLLATFLAVLMIVSTLPVSLLTTVFAAGTVAQYSVYLVDDNGDTLDLDGVTVTLGSSSKTTEAGAAVFTNVNEGNYTISITGLSGYRIADESSLNVTVYDSAASFGEPTYDSVKIKLVKTYDVTFNLSNGGIVTVDGTVYTDGNTKTVDAGDALTFTATADTGYHVEAVTGCDTELTGGNNSTSYEGTIANVAADTTVSATFAINQYTVSFTVNGDGTVESNGDTITDGGTVAVNHGDDLEFTATAENGYHVETVTGCDSVTYNEDNSEAVGKLEDIVGDKTIIVTFTINEYQLTAAVDDETHGSAVWADSETTTIAVNHGGSATLTITPKDGYAVDTVKVNDEETTAYTDDDDGISLTLTNIQKDTNVEVTFYKPGTENASDQLDNDYYVITFTEAPVKDYDENGTRVVVLKNNATATITPISPYTLIKSSDSNPNNTGYSDSLIISGTTTIENLYVSKGGKGKDNVTEVTANVKIIIDTEAPVVGVINEPDWTNGESTVSGSVSDTGDSGLYYIVWSKGSTLDEATILGTAKDAENRAEIDSNGNYSFTITGEQNATYYVYAVDYAGNVSEAKTVDVKIDTTAPIVTSYVFSTQENSIVQDLINFLSFGTLCKQTMYVTVTASDDESTVVSGVKEITLYYGDEGTSLGTKTATNGSAVFELTVSDFHNAAVIYAVATDVAGNNSEATKPTDNGVTTSANSDAVQIAEDKPTVTITTDAATYTDDDDNLWYNGNVGLTVDVIEEVSGIRSVTIKMNGTTLTSDMNGVDLTQDFSAGTEKVTSATFAINTSQNAVDGQNTIEVVVTSAAGVESETYTQYVYIDTTAPDVIGYEITDINGNALSKVLNFLTFGIFFNEQVEITVTASDANASAGVRDITLYLGGVEYKTDEVNGNNQATFTVTKDALEENTTYVTDISAKATDNVGNTTVEAVYPTTKNSDGIENSSLMLETVAPTIGVDYTKEVTGQNTATEQSGEWYADDVEFTVTASDADSGLRQVVITINDKELENKIYYNDEDTDTETHEEIYTVTTADAVIASDGSYTIKVVITDNAGNVNESYTHTVYKDTVAPHITTFDFEPADYVEGDESVTSVEVMDYGFYFKEDTNVTITAVDNVSEDTNEAIPSAGVKSITYYTVDINSGKSEETTTLVNADGQITITIPANFKGQIYAKATDNVENVAEDFVNPDSAIVENVDQHATEEHISFTKADASYTANDGTELYSSNVDVTLTVTDTYSGIRSIEWSVVAPYDTANNQSGSVTLGNSKNVVSGETDWEQTQTDSNLVTEMQKTITVANNSNNIIVYVKMTDRAGNTSEQQIEFSIDKTAPVISIEYDSNTPDSIYTDIYNANRTATVTITERNFSSSDVVYAITNTDGVIPALSSWTEHKNTESPDETYYTATVTYSADGDYTFDISFTDLAGNKANTVAQQAFTIDQTNPTVSVVYDNNSALNGNYYNANRIATITITEHNFDSSRVTIIGTATDDGVTSTFPTLSGWTDSGDTHTATIAYTADSKYTFDIEFLDKAGNSISDYTADTFYIDKTAPSLSITGVADQSANNGDVIPVITYSDTNFNRNNVYITLVGVNNGTVFYEGSYTDITNGQIYTYENFEEEKSVDDIYTLTATLTDFAGNQTTMSITFSVNRFGSTYDFSSIKSLIGKYLQSEQDIVFTETNVDALDLDGIVIKLTKNGTPTTLVMGVDYTVTVSGGDGQWYVYTYTISKSLFADDGTYSIAIYSVDAAGNVNENIDETKEAEISFAVDKTAPVITPIDLEEGKQYPVEGKTTTVEIKDNLLLESVTITLDGKEVDYIVDGESYTFDIPASNSVQDVVIIATDAAGNVSECAVNDVLVSTNIFARWYHNTPLFIGSIIGVVVVVLGVIIFLLFGRKKKEEEEN